MIVNDAVAGEPMAARDSDLLLGEQLGVIVFGKEALDATIDTLAVDLAGELQLLGGIAAQAEHVWTMATPKISNSGRRRSHNLNI